MGDPLAERIIRYLDRHMAWMRAVLRELDELERVMGSDDMERLLDAQARRTREAEHFKREHHGLLHEWNNGAGESAERRAAVKERAREAEKLSEALRARYQELLITAEGVRLRQRAGLDALRHGRDLIRKYRPGGDDAGFLDRKA